MEKVLILDWDVHFGNGTSAIFIEDPNVLYMSVHRFDGGSFYPGIMAGHYENVGSGEGEGFTVNIPWPRQGPGDAEYLHAFREVFMPIAHEFNPDLVLVSAGFDAARGDPLGGCQVTPECFGHLTNMMQMLAGGRCVLALEGGYNLTSISDSMACCTHSLLGDPLPRLQIGAVREDCAEVIKRVQRHHAKYWSCLKHVAPAAPVTEGEDPAAPTAAPATTNMMLEVELAEDADPKEREEAIRALQAEGLAWGKSKMVKLGRNPVKRLMIRCTVAVGGVGPNAVQALVEGVDMVTKVSIPFCDA